MEFARQDGWFRQGLYTLVLVPPCERCAFAVVRLLQDEVEYDEPGDAQFRPERYDHIPQAGGSGRRTLGGAPNLTGLRERTNGPRRHQGDVRRLWDQEVPDRGSPGT